MLADEISIKSIAAMLHIVAILTLPNTAVLRSISYILANNASYSYCNYVALIKSRQVRLAAFTFTFGLVRLYG